MVKSSAVRLVLLALVVASAPALAAGPREKLVVSDLSVGSADLEPMARTLLEQFMTELSRIDRFDVIGSSDVALMLGLERQRQLLGCAEQSASCLAEIGGALGARWLVSGALTRAGDLYRIDLKLVDTTMAKVVNRVGRTVESREELIRLPGPLTNELLGVMGDGGGHALSIFPWVTAGAGVVATAVGIGLMVGASSEGARLNANKSTFTWAELQTRGAGLQGQYWVGVALVGVGGAAAVGGLLWALLGAAKPPASVQVSFGPSMLVVGGRF